MAFVPRYSDHGVISPYSDMAESTPSQILQVLRRGFPWIQFEERPAAVQISCGMCQQVASFSTAMLPLSADIWNVQKICEKAAKIPALRMHINCQDQQRRYMSAEAEAFRAGEVLPSFPEFVRRERQAAAPERRDVSPGVAVKTTRKISFEDE